MIKDNIFTVRDWNQTGGQFVMQFDLSALARMAGVRVKEKTPDGHVVSYIDLPMPQAKKILKMIRKYAEYEDLADIYEAFKPNKKLLDAWLSTEAQF